MDKVVLLEMQLKEALDREQNLKRLNESLMNAMNGFTKQEKGKDIQILTNIHQEEINKLKSGYIEKITILEYELRQLRNELKSVELDYEQLKTDYDYLQNNKCTDCLELKQQLDEQKTKYEEDKSILAREVQEALGNQKQIFEYDLNVLKLKVRQLSYELESEKKEKEKFNKTINDLNCQHESTQRSLLSQINDLHKAHNETILQNNQFQLHYQQREQGRISKECQLEQDKIILEKHQQEYKEQIQKLEQQNKTYLAQLIEKENKFYEQKQDLVKKLNQEKKLSEQYQQLANKIKDEYQRKNSLLIEDNLKKESQIKHMQAQLNRQKSKNKYYENVLGQPDQKNSTPKVIKHKKNNYSNEYSSHQPPHISHTKNTLSQGHISKIKLFPQSIQKSEADSINFNLTDMLNTTRNPGDQAHLSSRQINEDGSIVEQFICNHNPKSSQISISLIKQETQGVLTDRQSSPKTKISQFKVPIPQRVRTINDYCKENNLTVRSK